MLINQKLIALILLLIGLINAGPLKRSEKSLFNGEIKCAKKCTDSKNFNYQIGRSYRYNFETKNVFASDVGTVLNEVKIIGHAKITIQSNCEHILKLENVDVIGASKDQKDKLVKELEENNLAYSFKDGEIDMVCPLSNELKWALNLKKAILSSLQFSPKQVLTDLKTSTVDEKDINGNCETNYELQSSNEEQYTIIKSKKLKNCSNRINVDSALLGSSSIANEIINMYINTFVQSDHLCKITITKKNGIINKVKCTQNSDGAKFIKKDLRTLHEISLEFSNEEPVHYPQLTGEYYEDNLYGEKIDLIENKEDQVTSSKELKNAIKNICETLSNSILNYQTAIEFRNLVNAVKNSKDDILKAELKDLLNKREHSTNAKNHNEVMISSTCCPHKLFKLYLEAIISAKNDASLKLLVNDIVPNNFYLQEGSVRAELKLISFYTSLAFYRNPNENTLKTALPLLKLKNRHNRNAIFGLTGLARTICKKAENCNAPTINDLANLIAQNIPADCVIKPLNENQVIESLKALENMPKLPESVLKKMVSCLKASNVSPNVKVSVIKSFNDKKEQELVKKAMRDVLMNSSEQDEVRIEAYKILRIQLDKELEKLVNLEHSELSSYIVNDIQRLRNDQSITCPKILAFKEATKNIDLKLTNQHGKSKRIVSHPLSLFFKLNLAVYTDIIYSPKTEKPISVTASFNLYHKEILQIGLRSESGSNLLLNAANMETIVDAVMQLVKNLNSKQEDDRKSRLIDEWAARTLPELANAFKEIDLYVKLGGINLIYINKNDQQVAFGNRLDKLKLGLAPILAIEQTSEIQIHSVSGMPTLVKKDKSILSNFALFDSQKVGDSEITFEITPSLVISQLVKLSYPIGRYQNNFLLENKQYLTSNFGLQGRKTNFKDKIQIRFKLSSQKVELLSHRIFNLIRDGKSVKDVTSDRINRDFCLDSLFPIRKVLGMSLCSRNNNNEKSIVLEKIEDSNVLITFQEENIGIKTDLKLTIEHENSLHKRKIVMMSKRGEGFHILEFEVDNPIGKGSAKITILKDKLNLNAKLNDQYVYSLEAYKSFETKDDESKFKAKIIVLFPGLTKPFTSEFTTKIINGVKFYTSGELTINEKTSLLNYEYYIEKYQRIKRENEYTKKVHLDLKLFNFKGQKYLHSKHEVEDKYSGAKSKHFVEYACPKDPNKLENFIFESKLDWEKESFEKFSMINEFKSSKYPKLNFKYDQKFVWKYEFQKLEYYENDINIELNALSTKDGNGDERKIRLGHVSTMNNMYKNSKKISMDHLIRIVINKINYNREISYSGNYELIRDGIYQINDKLKVQDISTSTEMITASVNLRPENSLATKMKLLIDYNCDKHGKFNWAEDISYDPQTKKVSTKIVLSISRADEQTPEIYNGEYTANDMQMPSDYELKLRKASDGTEVLHLKSVFSKPNEKTAFVDYYGERVCDFELKKSKNKMTFELIKLNIKKFGGFFLNNTKTPEGHELSYKLKLDSPSAYEQNAKLLTNKMFLSFNFSITKDYNELAQLELYRKFNRDVEIGSIMMKAFNKQLSFKLENQQTGFSSILELQKFDTKCKMILMAIKETSKCALMVKLEKDGVLKYALDSTYNKNSASIINLKTEVVNLNININPFGSNEEDWKVLTIDFSRKDGKYKNTSKVSIKKLVGKKHALAVKSSSSGKRLDKTFEHAFDLQISSDWSNLKLNAKFIEANKVDELDYLHELNSQDKIGFKFNHQFKLILRNELIFKHESNTKLDNDGKFYKLTSESEFKAKCKYINGVKINLKGNCDTNEKSGKIDLYLEYPHQNKVIIASYTAKNRLGEKFMRDFKVEISNTKLNEKDTYIAKLDSINGLELHMKYNKVSNLGHNLENLELRFLYKNEERSIVIVAPRGWSGYIKFLPPNKEGISFHCNLTKRGRVLFSVDSKYKITKLSNKMLTQSSNENRTLYSTDEILVHTVIGFNGNPKFSEETTEITGDEVKYKFTSVYLNVDAYLKGINSNKKVVNIKGCSAKQVTNCASLDAKIENTNKGTKSEGSFKYGLDEEAVTIKFNYNRQKLDNGDYQGKMAGSINDKKFTGEALIKKKGEMDIKINLPERVIQYTREAVPNGFKSTLYPKLNKDKSHFISMTFTSSGTLKRVMKLEILHPSFKRPLKVEIEILKQKSIKIVLDIANDENKKINLEAYRYLEDKNTKTGLFFFREDRKIDFGLTYEKSFIQNNNIFKIKSKRMQYWVDKNGKNLTMSKTVESNINMDVKGFVREIENKWLYKSANDLFDIDSKIHLDFKRYVFNGVYNLLNGEKNKKKMEFDYQNRCFKLESYELPKENYKNNHLVNLCVEGKSANQDLMKFEYVRPELDSKKRLKNNEKLLIKLSRADEQLLRAVMHWDPEMIGEWIVDGGEWIEEKQKSEAELINKIQLELEHKYNLLKDSLVNDLISPLRKYRQESFNEILSEINPKLAAKLRSKRAVIKMANKINNETEVGFVSFSENLAKKLFNFKLVRFSPEEGHIEFLFSPHPTFEGVKYSVKNSFKYLFKE